MAQEKTQNKTQDKAEHRTSDKTQDRTQGKPEDKTQNRDTQFGRTQATQQNAATMKHDAAHCDASKSSDGSSGPCDTKGVKPEATPGKSDPTKR